MKKKSAKKQSIKVSADLSKLATVLKMSVDDARKLATLEKQLVALKASKESSKCKVQRQRMRNMKFYRHEHTAETIALLQRVANTL